MMPEQHRKQIASAIRQAYPRLRGEANKCIGRISSNSSWLALLKTRNSSIAPPMLTSRSSTKLYISEQAQLISSGIRIRQRRVSDIRTIV
jgi:hypothetical protein